MRYRNIRIHPLGGMKFIWIQVPLEFMYDAPLDEGNL